MLTMRQDEYRAALAAFIRNNGVTRCPTACAVPTQATISAADRAALARYAARRRARQRKFAARLRFFPGRQGPGGVR
jgi:hypothetical protein